MTDPEPRDPQTKWAALGTRAAAGCGLLVLDRCHDRGSLIDCADNRRRLHALHPIFGVAAGFGVLAAIVVFSLVRPSAEVGA